MTELLRKAFERADRLSPQEQDALASFLMAELLAEGARLAGPPVWDLDAELHALGRGHDGLGRAPDALG
jgi:hypothetical protein